MKNSKKPPHKVSNVMKMMNKMLYTVFVFQVLIIILFASLNFKWGKDNLGKKPEIGDTKSEKQLQKSFIL